MSINGRLQAWHLLLLGALLVLPGFAADRLFGTTGLAYAGGWMGGFSALTFILYFWDKRQAQTAGWREPEGMLHLLEILGGWPGAFLAQHLFRHKSYKGSYQFVFWLIVGLHQFLAFDALRGWPLVRLVTGLAR